MGWTATGCGGGDRQPLSIHIECLIECTTWTISGGGASIVISTGCTLA